MPNVFGWKGMLISAAIGLLLGGGVTGGIGYKLHQAEITKLNKEHADALAAKETEIKQECQTAMDAATEVSNVYQNTIASLRTQLSKLKRVQPRCVPIIRANPPERSGRHNGSTGIG